ncbi:MAG: ABC transporter ATP-binding protein [Acidimicrobiales bacterium]
MTDGPRDAAAPLLEIRGLRTWFDTSDGMVKAVDGVDLDVAPGEVVGLVGESGSGKTVTALSLLRLIDEPGRIVDGSIAFAGSDLRAASNEQMRKVRGSRIGMIFQQPVSSLNPSYRVGFQVGEVYEVHEDLPRKAAEMRAIEMLSRVGIPDAASRSRSFPHQMSGGQAQRVMIAMALAAQPELLIADEPTTALDVTIQAQILDLIRDLQGDLGMAVLLITHDLGIVAELCDRVAVMYAGQIVEEADTRTLFRSPLHPYTVGLMGSVPVIGQRRQHLEVIGGRVPDLVDLPVGCRFAPRCEARIAHGLTRCTEALPALVEVEPGHQVRCYLHSDEVDEVEELAIPLTGPVADALTAETE